MIHLTEAEKGEDGYCDLSKTQESDYTDGKYTIA